MAKWCQKQRGKLLKERAIYVHAEFAERKTAIAINETIIAMKNKKNDAPFVSLANFALIIKPVNPEDVAAESLGCNEFSDSSSSNSTSFINLK